MKFKVGDYVEVGLEAAIVMEAVANDNMINDAFILDVFIIIDLFDTDDGDMCRINDIHGMWWEVKLSQISSYSKLDSLFEI